MKVILDTMVVAIKLVKLFLCCFASQEQDAQRDDG